MKEDRSRYQASEVLNNSAKKAFKLLGLPTSATLDEVNIQYKVLTLQYHPDRISDPVQKAIAQEKQKEINHARDVARKYIEAKSNKSANSVTTNESNTDGSDFWQKEAKKYPERETIQQKDARERQERDQAAESRYISAIRTEFATFKIPNNVDAYIDDLKVLKRYLKLLSSIMEIHGMQNDITTDDCSEAVTKYAEQVPKIRNAKSRQEIDILVEQSDRLRDSAFDSIKSVGNRVYGQLNGYLGDYVSMAKSLDIKLPMFPKLDIMSNYAEVKAQFDLQNTQKQSEIELLKEVELASAAISKVPTLTDVQEVSRISPNVYQKIDVKTISNETIANIRKGFLKEIQEYRNKILQERASNTSPDTLELQRRAYEDKWLASLDSEKSLKSKIKSEIHGFPVNIDKGNNWKRIDKRNPTELALLQKRIKERKEEDRRLELDKTPSGRAILAIQDFPGRLVVTVDQIYSDVRRGFNKFFG